MNDNTTALTAPEQPDWIPLLLMAALDDFNDGGRWAGKDWDIHEGVMESYEEMPMPRNEYQSTLRVWFEPYTWEYLEEGLNNLADFEDPFEVEAGDSLDQLSRPAMRSAWKDYVVDKQLAQHLRQQILDAGDSANTITFDVGDICGHTEHGIN